MQSAYGELAAGLLPWPGGIRRGATVAVTGSTSLLIAVLAGAMREGAWAAVVGMPAIGALAAQEYGIDLSRSYMVGDKRSDLQAGRAAGCRTILVLTGYGRKERAESLSADDAPDCVADDLERAVGGILADLAARVGPSSGSEDMVEGVPNQGGAAGNRIETRWPLG